jgi:(S)-mandelate dehydrogenase
MTALARCYNIPDLRAAAHRRLPKGIFEFIDRGTEDEIALRANREAFERFKLKPHVMVDVSKRSPETTLFGRKITMPMAIAPTGAAGLCWFEGELALARAAARANIPFTLATGSITAMEKIARDAGGMLWFQLYMWRDRSLSYQLVQRAHKVGFEALLLTVDTAVSANREYNRRNGFELPFRPNIRALLDMTFHPAWLTSVMFRYLADRGMPRHENYPEAYRRAMGSDPTNRAAMQNDSITWEDIARLRDVWPGKLMLKGVQRADDAARAAEFGVDGLIVSNHGGRNLDSARPSLEALPEVVQAVGDRAAVLLDSGVRRGSDIFKAVALGAKAVLTGRATLYGTAVGGEAGAAHAIALLKAELDKSMAYTGCRTIGEIAPDILAIPRRVQTRGELLEPV